MITRGWTRDQLHLEKIFHMTICRFYSALRSNSLGFDSEAYGPLSVRSRRRKVGVGANVSGGSILGQ